MFAVKELYLPKTIEEALEALAAHPEAEIIAGGTDVLVKMHGGGLRDVELVSIHDIPALRGVDMEGGDIRIGAMSSFAQVANDPIIQKHIPYLGEAVLQVGGPQIRNMGTIGGNVCNGAVSADSAPTLFALNAKLRLRTREGERIIPIQEFYLGPGRVDKKPGELLTHIIIERQDYAGYGGFYIKFSPRSAMDIATLGTACLVKTSEGRIDDLRLAYGVAAPTPLRCAAAEEYARGKAFSEEVVDEIAKTALGEAKPRTSWRASADFRMQLIEETARRALVQAYIRAGGVQ